jgi:dienelactone hydrolase
MMRMPKTRRLARRIFAVAGAVTALAGMAHGQSIASGNGEQSAKLPGATLEVFTYRPAGCAPSFVLLVFHGVNRDAGPYRDRARPLADRLCAVVAAPLFDKQRFPRDLYQYGGMVPKGGTVRAGHRTVDLVSPLAAWVRAALGSVHLPYALLGHSAGAQFADRVAAFTASDAARIVLANPSTWVMPSTTDTAPFGFGGIAPQGDAEHALQAYLGRPVTVLLGQADTGTRHLAISAEAMAQGPYRLARGRNAFTAARDVAARHGWRFGWTLAEVPGVGHNVAAMFASPEAADAFAGLAGRRP